MASTWRRFLVVLRRTDPVKVVLAGYCSYVLVGWILLCLPISWQAEPIGALDNLFTATSAMSTTGLVTVDTGTAYSPFGQAVILVLIQFGGIGYMTLGSFIVLARRRKLSRFREQIAQTTFTLPEDFDARRFVGQVVVFTVVVEAVGTLVLYIVFRDEQVAGAFWQALFHSVSTFCTAGFSLFSDSLERFRGDFWLNAAVGLLSYLGAIGFIVQTDLYRKLTGRARRITLTSKIILHTTLWVSLIGWVLLFLTEGAFRSMPVSERLMASWFQSMTAMTTVGFDTLPIGRLGTASVLLLVILMVIGASPSGTGGGLKSTTFSAIIATIRSVGRGQSRVTFWGHPIPETRVLNAFAALGLYVGILATSSFVLLLTESQSFQDVLFEAASALGTVGLSRGITGGLTPLGKIVITATMFVGRLSPLALGLALFAPGNDAAAPSEPVESDVAI